MKQLSGDLILKYNNKGYQLILAVLKMTFDKVLIPKPALILHLNNYLITAKFLSD